MYSLVSKRLVFISLEEAGLNPGVACPIRLRVLLSHDLEEWSRLRRKVATTPFTRDVATALMVPHKVIKRGTYTDHAAASCCCTRLTFRS